MRKSAHKSSYAGFTLIELLVVIAIISTLSLIIIQAINPQQSLTKAHDARRRHDATQLENAHRQYIISSGMMADDAMPFGAENAKPICRETIVPSYCTAIGGVDCSALSPDFIAELPVDSAEPCTSFLGYTTYQFGGLVPVSPAHIGKLQGDPPPGGCPPDAIQILDDGDAGFVTTGTWTLYSGAVYYQGDTTFHAGGGGGVNKARWTFTVYPGEYRVSATWEEHVNRATDSPFTIFDGSSPLSTVDINQELAPNDFTAGGVQWEDLGWFTVTGNQIVIELTDNANEYVMADGIRVAWADASPPDCNVCETCSGFFCMPAQCLALGPCISNWPTNPTCAADPAVCP